MRQYPVCQVPPIRFVANAYPQTHQIRSACTGDDGTHAVMCSGASGHAHTKLAQRKINIVVHDKDLILFRFVPAEDFSDALAGEIHKRLRFDQNDFLA